VVVVVVVVVPVVVVPVVPVRTVIVLARVSHGAQSRTRVLCPRTGDPQPPLSPSPGWPIRVLSGIGNDRIGVQR
jgi:hypothetical protein